MPRLPKATDESYSGVRINEFLETNCLTQKWLMRRLSLRGINVGTSFISRIISDERNSKRASSIRYECKQICDEYERKMNYAETESNDSRPTANSGCPCA